MDRLHIMPVTGTTILLGKHFGFLLNVGMQMAPLILLASWRLGLVAAAVGVAQGLSMAALYLAWGNWMSISHPIKLQFFQFSTANGLIVEALAGIMIGSLPGMLNFYFLYTGGIAAVWKVVLVLLCSCLVYSISLWRFGNQFSQREEAIRNAVS